jgi:hypothetical protein
MRPQTQIQLTHERPSKKLQLLAEQNWYVNIVSVMAGGPIVFEMLFQGLYLPNSLLFNLVATGAFRDFLSLQRLGMRSHPRANTEAMLPLTARRVAHGCVHPRRLRNERRPQK